MSLTTTGYGDIVLAGDSGRWLAMVILVLGVTLFLQLARAVVQRPRVEISCPQCGLEEHDRDALHCKRCGSPVKR